MCDKQLVGVMGVGQAVGGCDRVKQAAGGCDGCVTSSWWV